MPLPRILGFALAILFLMPFRAHAAEPAPVFLGLSAEFGLKNSTSAQSIELGIRTALAEINAAGGVLGGRPLELMTRDNRSVPARGVEDLRQFAAIPDMVAVFGGRFSPVMIEQAPVAEDLKIILLNPWSSADGITKAGSRAYTFRLSLMDSLAMPAMMRSAKDRDFDHIALVLPNSAWGRSNREAARDFELTPGAPNIVTEQWYDFGAASLESQYKAALNAGAEAILLIANDIEGTTFVKGLAALPAEQRLPVLSHWGLTGGLFFEAVRYDLPKIDFSVIQTFSFARAAPAKRDAVMATVRAIGGPDQAEDIPAPVGFGHAYDLTHLIARAINAAATTDRSTVRAKMESLGPYDGLVRSFQQPFSARSHDALTADDVFMTRYRPDGVLEPVVQ